MSEIQNSHVQDLSSMFDDDFSKVLWGAKKKSKFTNKLAMHGKDLKDFFLLENK
jgi:hypothetical protein